MFLRGWLEWIGWLVKNEFVIEVCENGAIKDLGHSVGVPVGVGNKKI